MNKQSSTSSERLAKKQHFQILDGLRGLAAIAVVIFHFMEIAVPDYNDSFIAHAYLAVDFFFCLSGFVIAYAYDQRLKHIGVVNFFKLRLIRLHPLVIIGTLIGVIAFAFDPLSNLIDSYRDTTFIMVITSFLMIPYPLVKERYFNLFHLNPPTWSLFWEYVVNIAYAFLYIRIRNKSLWCVVLLAALLLIGESFRSGNLAVGWGGDNFWGGGARVFFSFSVGILIYRSQWKIRTKLGFPVVAFLLFAVFLIPFSERYNFVIDPLIVIFYFPFLIILGTGASLKRHSDKICRFSGEISYPLYMIHYPFIWLFMSYVESTKPALNEMISVMVIGVVLLIALAYMILIYIDEPIRKYLMNRVRKDSSSFYSRV